MKAMRAESGYVLLLLLLLLLGAGGVVLAGFTQQVKQEAEEQRYEHNRRVLQEAKQALLMYAYNYPVNNPGRGPGRLPCPDTDDPVGGVTDGLPNPSFNCINGNAMVGRFPWKDPDLNFFEARDASGEHLWYAVSRNFANSISPAIDDVINSDTVGTITLVDQSGSILYDGAVSGIAAVIIAPGTIVRRDENNDGNYEYPQVRDTDARRGDPRNYLDTFNGFDNSAFNNDESDTDDDGFILGPIFDTGVSDVVVNDQIVIVTADEVIAMAEKAVLQAYRDAIIAYLAPLAAGGTGGQYPWLYNYDVNTVAELDGSFPAETVFANEILNKLGNNGRIPSMFDPYFSEADSESIESKISVDINNANFMGNIGYLQNFPVSSSGIYTFVNTIWNGDPTIDGPANMDLNIETTLPITGLRFVDDPAPNLVKLVGSIAASETYSLGPFWFWSRNDLGVTQWAKCRSIHLIDCHVDSAYIPDPHGTGQRSIQILRVDVDLVFDSSAADLVEFTFDVSSLAGAPANPVITPADINGHAKIAATFAAANIPGSLVQIRYEWDDNYTDGNYDVDESGTLNFSDLPGATLELGLRFYPELPAWAYDNGWHNSVMMAYADDYRPDIATGPCSAGTDCLQIDNTAWPRDNKASLLILGGESDWVDDDADGMADEIADVFDPENDDFDSVFDARANGGNDKLLVIEEL